MSHSNASGPDASLRKTFVVSHHHVSSDEEKETLLPKQTAQAKKSLKELLPAPAPTPTPITLPRATRTNALPLSSPSPSPSPSRPSPHSIVNDDFFSLDAPIVHRPLARPSLASSTHFLHDKKLPLPTASHSRLPFESEPRSLAPETVSKLFSSSKRSRMSETPITIKEIRQDDQIQVSRSIETSRALALEEEQQQQPSIPFGMVPSKKAKVKNNVMSLAYNVATKEKELEEFHANSRKVRQETRFKYGF